jgi:hypothetical protein
MGSVSSVNPGVANLLQTLTNLNSPVMSSPAAENQGLFGAGSSGSLSGSLIDATG